MAQSCPRCGCAVPSGGGHALQEGARFFKALFHLAEEVPQGGQEQTNRHHTQDGDDLIVATQCFVDVINAKADADAAAHLPDAITLACVALQAGFIDVKRRHVTQTCSMRLVFDFHDFFLTFFKGF